MVAPFVSEPRTVGVYSSQRAREFARKRAIKFQDVLNEE